MRVRWQIAALAIGVALCYAAIALIIGMDTAAIIVAAAGVAYSAIKVFSGDTSEKSAPKLVARIFAVNRMTYAAIVLSYFTAFSIFAFPLVRQGITSDLTVTVRDENLQPISSAQLSITGMPSHSISESTPGSFKVSYIPYLAGTEAAIDVQYQGRKVSAKIAKDAADRFTDTVVPVWSGKAALRATYFTAQGPAVSAFLFGQLPPALKDRFPKLRAVVANRVFQTAKSFSAIYEQLGSDSITVEFEDRIGGGKPVHAKADYSVQGDNPFSRKVWKDNEKVRNVRAMDSRVDFDFSRNLLGAAVDRRLPSSFRAELQGAGSFYEGTAVRPDPAAERYLSKVGAVERGENGSVSIRLTKELTRADLSWIVLHGRMDDEGLQDEPTWAETKRYLQFALAQGIPDNLIDATFHFNPEDGCWEDSVHAEFVLPPPVLRVAVLENVSDHAIPISQLIMATRQANGYNRAAAKIALGDEAMPFDAVQPGEAVIVPVSIAIESAPLPAPTGSPAPADNEDLEFSLTPLPTPSESEIEHGAGEADERALFRPAKMILAESQIDIFDPVDEPARVNESEVPRIDTNDLLFVGPNVENIRYVVNEVAIPVRSDSHSVIAMYGGWEGGSCPFVFAQYPDSSTPINLGQVITNRIGVALKGSDQVALGKYFSNLSIRELEDEISYIDEVALLVDTGTETVVLRPQHAGIRRVDGRYAVLRKGERIDLDFGDLTKFSVASARLRVDGYYVPLHRTAMR